ncbi:MAG TPA: hypothetical protein VM029_17120 [Opitutaceae bacterium]|nr:hypothetical protein [Opitutaceae bacterium]
MKRTPFLPALLCAALVLVVARGGTPPRGVAASPVLRAQIDALLKARQWPEPLPVDPPNPFVVINDNSRSLLAGTGRAPGASRTEDTKPAVGVVTSSGEAQTPATAAEILGNTASRLKLGGVIQLKDQMQIVVNDLPRREGDFITVVWNHASYALRVVRIQPGLLVLRYEGAEITLPF